MTAPSTAVLAELVGRKHDCLVQLHALGVRKQEMIDVGAVGASLFGILAETQQLIEQLQQLERGLDPFRGDDPLLGPDGTVDAAAGGNSRARFPLRRDAPPPLRRNGRATGDGEFGRRRPRRLRCGRRPLCLVVRRNLGILREQTP